MISVSGLTLAYPGGPRAVDGVDLQVDAGETYGFLGPDVPLDVQVRDVYEGIDERDIDRVVLDLPEPWRVVKHAAEVLVPGGIMLAYLPTILQVGRLKEELSSAPFAMIETIEVLHRSWHVEGQSIRPDHRMVAHTGFLTVARHLADEAPPAPGGE